jgi:hypothetical protein
VELVWLSNLNGLTSGESKKKGMATNSEMYMKCLQIEAMVKIMVMKGITDNRKLVEAVDNMYHPTTEWEQEMFSEAIIYAKHAVLN